MIFGLLQAWSIAAGFVLGVGFTLDSALDAVVLATCLILAKSTSRQLHIGGLAVVWVAYVANILVDAPT